MLHLKIIYVVTTQLSLTKKINVVLCLKTVFIISYTMSKVRIIGDMMKNNCCCVKNNRQDVQEYKNRIIGQKKGIIFQGLLSSVIQWNLRITDTLGAGPLSVIRRCPYLGGCY